MNTQEFQQKLLNIQDTMMNYGMILTGNEEEAQDLVQDTTLKILDNQDKYVDNVNFKGWVLTIMRNIFINNYRKVVRSQTIIDESPELYNLKVTSDSGFDTPGGSFEMHEIMNAVNDLHESVKVPFSMYLSGHKYNEIAKKLDLPLGTVKSRIFFARRELQSVLLNKEKNGNE